MCCVLQLRWQQGRSTAKGIVIQPVTLWMKPAVFEDSAIDLFLNETLMGRIVYPGNVLKRKNSDDGGSNTQAFLLWNTAAVILSGFISPFCLHSWLFFFLTNLLHLALTIWQSIYGEQYPELDLFTVSPIYCLSSLHLHLIPDSWLSAVNFYLNGSHRFLCSASPVVCLSSCHSLSPLITSFHWE